MVGQKNNKLLVVDKFKFFKKHVSKANVVRWKCVRTSCKAIIYTTGETLDIFHSEKNCFEHNHLQETNLNREEVRNSCKRKAVEQLNEKPSKIIRKEVSNFPMENNLTTKDISLIRRSIYRSKSKVFPTLPKDRLQTQQVLEGLGLKTNREENFLIENDFSNGIILFGCETNIAFLRKSASVYMDGTFEYCPKYFYQLYTIHGFINNTYVPLLFALLPDKTINTYTNLFEKIRKLDIIPNTFVVDFEIAVHKTLEIIFEGCDIRGCNFHLKQSWYRKIKNLGLSQQYNKGEDEVGKWLIYVFGLPFLESKDISECFVEDLMSIKPIDEKLDKFCDYLVDTYISEDSLFPPKLWSNLSSDLYKSTNACESFHSDFNAHFYHHHPNIYTFLDVLKTFQTNTYIKIRSAELKVVRREKKSSLIQQSFIETKLQNFKDGIINRLEFIKYVSYKNKVCM